MAEVKKPEIRFSGFDAEWDVVPLRQVATINPSSVPPEVFEYVDLASVEGTELVSQRTERRQTAPSRAQRVARAGDIFYQTVRPYQRNNYLFEKSDGDYVFSTGYAQLRPSVESEMLFATIHRDEFVREVLDRCTGTSFPAIAPSDLQEIVVSVPHSTTEQQQIGTFFSNLDDLIVQHRSKLFKLRQTKSSLLQKMFPQGEADKPELRMDGFTEAWGVVPLLDTVERIIDFRGRTPKKLGMDWSDSGHLALSANSVKNGFIDFSRDVHYGNDELYSKWMTGRELHEGQVLFTTEAPMGNVARVPDSRKYILSQRVIAFDLKLQSVEESFFAVVLRSPWVFDQLTSLSSGGTAQGISQRSLEQVRIAIPNNLDEQVAVASVFSELDDVIFHEQQYIEKLKQAKTSLLQKMVV